jgi:hypothetical protein
MIALTSAIPDNAINTNQTTQPRQGFDLGKWLSGLFVNNAPQQPAQQPAQQSALPQQGQIPQLPGGANAITGDGTQAGMNYATQFTTGFQQGMTTTPITADQILGGGQGGQGGQDMMMKGQTMGTDLVTGMNSSLASASIDTSGITSGLDGTASQMGNYGTQAGDAYKNNLQSSISGASGIAQSEADNVVAALRSSIEGARKAGEEAGRAYHEGFTSTKGDDMHSPGRAARAAKKEAGYLITALNTGIEPSKLAGQQTGFAYSRAVNNSFDTSISAGSPDFSGTLNDISNGIGVTGEIKNNNESTDASNGNRNVVINNNFHIDKIDSKERVREIAETLVHIMTFNNETAGRNTDVGL